MKVKVNNRILLGLLVSVILALSGCSIPSTITAVIVDIKGKPVSPTGGISVTATSGAELLTKADLQPDGSAMLRLTNPILPIIITGTGGEHKFSIVTLTSADQLRGTVTIVEDPINIIKLPGALSPTK